MIVALRTTTYMGGRMRTRTRHVCAHHSVFEPHDPYLSRLATAARQQGKVRRILAPDSRRLQLRAHHLLHIHLIRVLDVPVIHMGRCTAKEWGLVDPCRMVSQAPKKLAAHSRSASLGDGPAVDFRCIRCCVSINADLQSWMSSEDGSDRVELCDLRCRSAGARIDLVARHPKFNHRLVLMHQAALCTYLKPLPCPPDTFRWCKHLQEQTRQHILRLGLQPPVCPL